MHVNFVQGYIHQDIYIVLVTTFVLMQKEHDRITSCNRAAAKSLVIKQDIGVAINGTFVMIVGSESAQKPKKRSLRTSPFSTCVLYKLYPKMKTSEENKKGEDRRIKWRTEWIEAWKILVFCSRQRCFCFSSFLFSSLASSAPLVRSPFSWGNSGHIFLCVPIAQCIRFIILMQSLFYASAKSPFIAVVPSYPSPHIKQSNTTY